jgi:hypothetical protein
VIQVTPRAKFFKGRWQSGRISRSSRRDVVSLGVDVNPTFVVHVLDLHNNLVLRSFQHAVVAAAARVLGVHGATARSHSGGRACRQIAPRSGRSEKNHYRCLN